jgi:uncharacterized protein YabE (DUF348 family)
MQRGMRLAVYGAAVAIMAGGTLAWLAIDKTVHFEVDGHSKAVHTLGSHVRDVLAAAGYRLSPHDRVTPSPGAGIHDGSRIVVHRARLLQLTVDGIQHEVWTTEPTVDAALADLGVALENFVSLSRDQRLPVTPTAIEVRTPKNVTLKHDGTIQRLTTTDETVGQLLSDAGVQIGELDRLSAPLTDPIDDGQAIVVQRVRSTPLIKIETIPYATQQQNDGAMEMGTTKLVAAGAAGAKQVTYALVYVDGKFAGKSLVGAKIVKSPTAQLVKVGTRAVTPQQIAAELVAARGWGSDELNCLTLLWNHESSWRIDAVNPDSGAYGIPQALPADKMATVAPDWRMNARTQITWGLNYIAGVYGTPCGAWAHELDVNWY